MHTGSPSVTREQHGAAQSPWGKQRSTRHTATEKQGQITVMQTEDRSTLGDAEQRGDRWEVVLIADAY